MHCEQRQVEAIALLFICGALIPAHMAVSTQDIKDIEEMLCVNNGINLKCQYGFLNIGDIIS